MQRRFIYCLSISLTISVSVLPAVVYGQATQDSTKQEKPQHNKTYIAQQNGYPAQQGAYPSQQSGYPAQQGGYPAQQGGYPAQQGGYPALQAGYPAQQGGYPAQQGGYPAQQGGYPAQQGGYPAQQGGYPAQQGGSPAQQAGYPAQQAGYPAQQAGYPAQQGGYPSQQGGFAPQQGNFSSQQAGFPNQQGSFPPQPGAYSSATGAFPPQGKHTQQTLPPSAASSAGGKNQGASHTPQQAAKVYQWFLNYDEIRRRAQMNPIEKQQADALLARGLSLFMPGQDKLAGKQLLTGLVIRYQTATQSMKSLQVLPETQKLQESYFLYFDSAMHLFSDYLKVQDNLFAVDNSGQSIAKQLIQRKLELENLEHSCKELDAQTRKTYGVAAFQF